MSDDDLGPMPDPVIEPGEPNPGGVDAVPESDGIEAQEDGVLSRDPAPDDNPAVEDVLPDDMQEQMKEGQDTSTEATRSEDGTSSSEADEKESSA